MQFSYSAKSLSGEMTSGLLDADTISIARQKLRERGMFPLKLAPSAEKRMDVAVATAGFWKPRVKKQELMLLTSQLVIMCRAGVDLAEALQNVAPSCRNPTLKRALNDIYRDVA